MEKIGLKSCVSPRKSSGHSEVSDACSAIIFGSAVRPFSRPKQTAAPRQISLHPPPLSPPRSVVSHLLVVAQPVAEHFGDRDQGHVSDHGKERKGLDLQVVAVGNSQAEQTKPRKRLEQKGCSIRSTELSKQEDATTPLSKWISFGAGPPLISNLN